MKLVGTLRWDTANLVGIDDDIVAYAGLYDWRLGLARSRHTRHKIDVTKSRPT